MPQKKEIAPHPLWPLAERPRERLFLKGVAALSDADLLAILLRFGKRGKNAKELAVHLLQSAEGLIGLSRLPLHALLDVPGLGPAKAASLSAAFEIGNRLLAERIKGRSLVESATDVFNLLRGSLIQKREETLVGVLLNAKNEVIRIVTFAEGDANKALVSVPQVMRRILAESATAVIFAHNHPSGDPSPSLEDKKLTARLFKACTAVDIVMHDHLIIGNPGFFSFVQTGQLNSG